VRNPEDVLISLYRYFCVGDWPKYAGFRPEHLPLELFAAGIFASHFNHGLWGQVASWYACCWNDTRVHWVTYEDLTEHPTKHILGLARFLGVDTSDHRRLAIAEAQASRSFMLKHRTQFDDHVLLMCQTLAMRRSHGCGTLSNITVSCQR